MEGFTLSRISRPIINNLDPKQFAVAGKSTSHALAYILHIILESLDKGGCLARLFFADFRKGFDLIDHQILLRKLAQFDLYNCLLRWVAEPFLVLIEYVPFGDLLGYLRKSRGLNDTYFKDPDIKPQTNLTSQQLMKFAWQIADGMSYLSSKSVSCRKVFPWGIYKS